MTQNAIRHGAIAFGAAITSGALAFSTNGNSNAAVTLVGLVSLIFGVLAAFANSEVA